MRPGMRASSILSEAARNLASGTTRAALLGVVLALALGALAMADVRSVVAILSGAEDYRQSGAAVQVLEAVGLVDGARCDALGATTGITEAGALRRGEPMRALALPASELTVWEVTPGVVALLAEAGAVVDEGVSGGLWVSSDLAASLGAEPGDVIETSTGPATVAGVYPWPDDGRARTLGFSVISPVPAAGEFDSCWAQVWPADANTANLMHTTLAPGGAEVATTSRLNESLGASYDGVGLLAARQTGRAPLGAALLGAALGWTAVRMRRLEVAAALHARVPKSHLGWQHVAETTAWVTAAVVIATGGVTWAALVGNPDPPGEALAAGLRTVAAGAAATLLGSLAGVAVTRERHLFRYFKDR